ncbi:MAG: EpsI family protein [Acidobacteria bacterium]|nr:EpsI family protein [Acidobacteriota bacterium]
MSEGPNKIDRFYIGAALVAAAFVFLYANTIGKLAYDWWTDENYSHGLLVPFVIALIIWKERGRLRRAVSSSPAAVGMAAIVLSAIMLLAGTLGAELFTQRISMVLLIAGLAAYFLGMRVVRLLAVPFTLLLLAIPIPQIIFNRIALPLQGYASQMAVAGIRLFAVPTVRSGNVIDILPQGAAQPISLEVVEACSGIRSLMTLVTLALVLAYFTRRGEGEGNSALAPPDFWRAVILMLAAVPIAVITNAGRVTATGVMTYYYGSQATQSTTHDVFGWLVYVVALGLLIGLNAVLIKISRRAAKTQSKDIAESKGSLPHAPLVPLVVVLVVSGLLVNWFALRGEEAVPRSPLAQLPTTLGDWKQKGSEFKFDPAVESVLKATDYTMREYSDPSGRVANVYVGYYATQRTGATYHSPQNCLPGAGWVLRDPQVITITSPEGRTFSANRFIIENDKYSDVMIYWYQGRGRTEASEFKDKIDTVLDSVTRRRSDGAMVRVMTDLGSDETASMRSACDLAAQLADQLDPYIPR